MHHPYRTAYCVLRIALRKIKENKLRKAKEKM